MLHHRHRQGLAGNPLHSNHESEEDADFHFWGAPNNTLSGSFGAYSPTLWKEKASENDNHDHEDCYESSPLLPNSHRSTTNLSSERAIAEGRMQIMEMIQDMPEYCFELSLRDIVDEQHVEEAGVRSETEPQIKKKKKKKIKARQMSRISSMESETFLLKMFFPSSLSFKKKSKAAGNCSNVSPNPSPEATKLSSINKEWWMSRFFLAGENKRSRGSSRNSSTSSHEEANFIPGCWSFFHSKKNKTKRQRGCIVGVESN